MHFQKENSVGYLKKRVKKFKSILYIFRKNNEVGKLKKYMEDNRVD